MVNVLVIVQASIIPSHLTERISAGIQIPKSVGLGVKLMLVRSGNYRSFMIDPDVDVTCAIMIVAGYK